MYNYYIDQKKNKEKLKQEKSKERQKTEQVKRRSNFYFNI